MNQSLKVSWVSPSYQGFLPSLEHKPFEKKVASYFYSPQYRTVAGNMEPLAKSHLMSILKTLVSLRISKSFRSCLGAEAKPKYFLL